MYIQIVRLPLPTDYCSFVMPVPGEQRVCRRKRWADSRPDQCGCEYMAAVQAQSHGSI